MVRKIKVVSTAGVSGTIETNVTTLAELKPLLSSQLNVNYGGMKMVIGETRNELSSDESILPSDDFKLYLMPQKTKSGSDKTEIYEKLAEAHDALADLYIELSEIEGEGESEFSEFDKKVSKPHYEEDKDISDFNELLDTY